MHEYFKMASKLNRYVIRSLSVHGNICLGVDRSGECHMVSTSFHIDVTPPSSGKIRVGPYFDMVSAFI